jgi:hypothetical protein
MYTDALINGGTFAQLDVGDHVIQTTLDYAENISAKYLVLKLDDMKLEYVKADYPNLITSYSYVNPTTGMVGNKIRIQLPVIDTVQQTIPYAGQWTITLYNTREAQRQSLSKALKPKADL